MSGIQYFRSKHFDRALKEAKLGGPSKRFATKVRAVLGSLEDSDPFHGLRKTRNGETRIPKCVKYDLGDGWRLVTVQDSRICGFIFMGDHEAVDRFLDQHRGMSFGIRDGKLIHVPGHGSGEEPAGYRPRPSFEAFNLTEQLGDEEDFVLHGVSSRILRGVHALDSNSTVADIESAVAGIEPADRQEFVRDVLSLVRAGNEDGWKKRIAYARGEIVDTEAVDPDRQIFVEDGDEIRGIEIGSEEYERYMAALQRDSDWHDWFLYLHPEQERVVRKHYDGPARLSGVSGSGKTCVLVRRAVRLAERPGSSVLILTLNRSLAGLLTKLVDACAGEQERPRIRVASFFDTAKELLIELEPSQANSLKERTWKLAEHVDEVFREYFRCWLNNNDAQVLRMLQRQLTARRVSAETYLREEFDWIRSAVGPAEREKYLALERTGRRVPIAEDRRRDILAGLEGWEKKMEQVGVVDYLALTNMLTARLSELSPRYDHVLIDEAQDFGTTELRIIRQLVLPGPDDIFLCGDIAQTVLPKHRSLQQAGIDLTARDQIRRNYRNSREILRAAYELLINNLDESLFDDDGLELLDPEYANFSGPAPLALEADNLENELGYARTYARSQIDAGAKSACIAIAGFSARDVEAFGRKCGITSLNGLYDPRETPLVLSDLEQTKGYEFDLLIVVNCRDGVIPAKGAPEEEAFRQGCKLYVAMTRARRELILSYSGNPSPWLLKVADTISVDEWSACEQLDETFLGGIPEVLPEVQEPDTEEPVGSLTGEEYLHTEHALGLAVETQTKLAELVDGRGAVSSTGKRVRWKTLTDLAADLGRSRRHDLTFGPKMADEVRESLASALTEAKLFPGVRP